MRKTAKYILIAIAAFIALLIAAAGFFAASFDPNEYKPQIIRLVQEKTQRNLSIPGDIELSFFPRLGIDLGKVALSERNSSEEFASFNNAEVSMALLPLLSKQLVIDHVRLEGLRAQLVRYKDGSTNLDNFVVQEQPDQGGAAAASTERQVSFDIDSVNLIDAHVQVEDRQQGRSFDIADLDLQTGKIADKVPSELQLSAVIKGKNPEVDAKLVAGTGFTMDLEAGRYVINGLDAQLKGAAGDVKELAVAVSGDADLKPAAKRFALEDIKLNASGTQAGQPLALKLNAPNLAVTDARVSGGKIEGEALLTQGGRAVNAIFSIPSIEGTPQALAIPALNVEATIKQDQLDAKATLVGALQGNIDALTFSSPKMTLTLSGRQGDTPLKGTLTTPFSVDLKSKAVKLSQIGADFRLPSPGGGAMSLVSTGRAEVQYNKPAASATLNGTLDQSKFNAKLGFAGSPATYTFDVGIDQLDLDKYKSKPGPEGQGAPAATGKSAPAEQPTDFAWLQDLQAKGSMRIGALKAANLKTSNVRFDLRANDGRLDVSPLSANLYGGSANGALSLISGKPARFAVRQTLSGIQLGPLLQDAIDKNPIDGKGNVVLDVTASGMNFDQIKSSLNGNARLDLRDGAVQGVNIAQAIRNAKTRIGALRGEEAPQSGSASAAEKTDFSELSGSFSIVNGVAHNDDLNIKSPLLRVNGSGQIFLGEERLDYLARTTVVSTLQGQGGPELQALKGLTVPVKLYGPFSSINWRVDFAGLASELARQKIDERKDEVKAKVQKELDEQKSKLQEQLKEGFKGLFGR